MVYGHAGRESGNIVPCDPGRVARRTAVSVVLNGRPAAAALVDDLVSAEDPFQPVDDSRCHAGSTTSRQAGHSAHTASWPSLVSYSIRTLDAVMSVWQCGHVPSRDECCIGMGGSSSCER